MSEAELDALPQGIIELNRSGTILYYNQAQADLAHRTRAATVGLNFFRDVAPCTAVKDFQGRFNEFAEQRGDSFAPFTFLFRAGWEEKRVMITLIRRAKTTGDAIYVAGQHPRQRLTRRLSSALAAGRRTVLTAKVSRTKRYLFG